MSKRVYTEEEIEDLTDRVFLLRERIDQGKLKVAEHLAEGFFKSLQAIRLRPDGKVDPDSVDGRIRATTMAIRAMQYREEAKEAVTLGAIQTEYFDFLFHEFGWLFEQMQEAKAEPGQVAYAMSESSDFVKDMAEGLPELANILREFWGNVFDPGSYHLQDGQQLKVAFAGDLFPPHWNNAVSTAGLYVDTIILPCPIMRVAPMLGVAPDREVVRMIVKHSLTAMTYREVATAEFDPPIALVLPNRDDIHVDERQTLVNRAMPLALKHAGYLFHREFESAEHLKEFCDKLQTIDQVLAELKGQDRLLFDTDWGRTAREQLQTAFGKETALLPGLKNGIAGDHIFQSCLSRMPQALGAQENAVHFGGTP
ncbi:hypothetical protein, partial [Paraburkholderia sp. J63]|uniref:hypothetical protein n=1 Tax=Paraburkholderia sp. J63 TaxID=2805434 RepID=UPI002ABE5D4C